MVWTLPLTFEALNFPNITLFPQYIGFVDKLKLNAMKAHADDMA
jgi:hypothetical protein